MKSNLDVWTIQKNKDETITALERVDKDSLGNILYLNCLCKFKIDGKRIDNRNFYACFYSEDSDTVILFTRGLISEEEIVKYLEDADIKYTTIRFEELEDEYEDNHNFPEVWFAREDYVLADAIDDSLKKGVKECTYYPKMESSLFLDYKDINGEKHGIEGRVCKGCLLFKDKLVLVISQRDPRNLEEKDIKRILKAKGIACNLVVKR